uniref:uncharacterized protein LOC122597776 n=1 Tax=Erigeron canadensis TaxID=72917 RepID=UPI001CB9D6FB|nr:uncharacterized protein LOC122597776 [Erigeron canadensis]
MRNAVSVSYEKGERLVCPKPRRFGVFNAPSSDAVRPLIWHMCFPPAEPYESKAGRRELLELIFEKSGDYGAQDKSCTDVASSPPFFSGSPPSRVSNPLIKDTRFRNDNVCPKISIPTYGMSSAYSSEEKVGSVDGNFGSKPAVRIEGFDCLARDNQRSCSIPSKA